ncbi:uncharacterized protein LOC100180115 [Anopheles sinensis]|uniref:Uncharacterized protein LOC100180115 n=1 Tax=Anopheles sinensis TaxID=74873 RepID=A0A084WTK9_ANOSI|nr:uncharacterized protein LOC100180115 [Anopheles sinensis]
MGLTHRAGIINNRTRALLTNNIIIAAKVAATVSSNGIDRTRFRPLQMADPGRDSKKEVTQRAPGGRASSRDAACCILALLYTPCQIDCNSTTTRPLKGSRFLPAAQNVCLTACIHGNRGGQFTIVLRSFDKFARKGTKWKQNAKQKTPTLKGLWLKADNRSTRSTRNVPAGGDRSWRNISTNPLQGNRGYRRCRESKTDHDAVEAFADRISATLKFSQRVVLPHPGRARVSSCAQNSKSIKCRADKFRETERTSLQTDRSHSKVHYDEDRVPNRTLLVQNFACFCGALSSSHASSTLFFVLTLKSYPVNV